MLPLLAYKLYRYKKETMMKSDAKPKPNNNGVKNVTKSNHNSIGHSHKIKIKKPTMMEIMILLFGMFGVPISYFCYWNVISLYQWSVFNETHSILTSSLPLELLDNSPFHFDPIAVSIKEIIETRVRNMHKYRFNYSWTDIDRRSDLSLDEFRDMYSGKWPVIITDCGSKWPAFKKWNTKYFEKHYAKELVAIKTMADDVIETFAMPLEIYLKHLHEGYPHQWTYLSDEMFIPSRPQLERDLGTCKETAEDFFKMFPIEVRPWWSLILWGTRFSRSELHMDPFNWTGTNMVISGLKQWKLFPPGQDHLLHVIPQQKYKFPINSYKYNSEIDCFKENSKQKYPSLQNAKVIEFYQYPGELLIIPTGWFHQAFNEEVTLAVAGQMMDSGNYRNVLEEIFKGGDLPRGAYNASLRIATPREQVKAVLNKVTNEIRNEGVEATRFLYDQMKKLAESLGLPVPPSILDLTLSQQGVDKKSQ